MIRRYSDLLLCWNIILIIIVLHMRLRLNFEGILWQTFFPLFWILKIGFCKACLARASSRIAAPLHTYGWLTILYSTIIRQLEVFLVDLPVLVAAVFLTYWWWQLVLQLLEQLLAVFGNRVQWILCVHWSLISVIGIWNGTLFMPHQILLHIMYVYAVPFCRLG